MDLAIWLVHLQSLIEKLETLDLGYPLGNHRIYPPADRATLQRLIQRVGLFPASPLIALYTYCDGINLPDVHNGYFIHGVASLLNGLERGEPTRLASNPTHPIIAFGSDGGGGRFATRADEAAEILFLPSGAVHNATFDDKTTPTKVLSPDFTDFLSRLESDITAFLADDRDWNYIS